MTVVTKANILKKTDGKFTALCHEVAADYPEITVDDYYIDIMAANLVNERVRSGFQVLLLPNLYGDIITDEAAQLQGGVGTAGSANIGDRYAMFEAIHGSAPRMIERGMATTPTPRASCAQRSCCCGTLAARPRPAGSRRRSMPARPSSPASRTARHAPTTATGC